MIQTAAQLQERAAAFTGTGADDAKTRVLVSMGTCGIAAGATPILNAFRSRIEEHGLSDRFETVEVGCMGLCHHEPSVEVMNPDGTSVIYGDVAEDQISAILGTSHPVGVHPSTLERGWYYPESEDKPENVFQARVVLRNCGRIDPENVDAYIGSGGYAALARAVTEMSPDQVIREVTEAGLRGRGGGGFPTGKKWSFAAAQQSEDKYVVCNADEGDPGAFMDRAVLEGDPHAVLEAMAIAGYATGAAQGVIYIRAEYPLAVRRLQLAINQARKLGLLGEGILGSAFSFDIDIKYGAGAFVCGEETALIHSVEGQRGEPTFKPPYPAVEGLWGKPTVVNNVETFANVPAILRHGPAWFRTVGTEQCPGTKVFALAGKVSNVGLVEVPMGTKLRDIVFGVGGGIMGGKEFKAAQTGGPSGGCITAEELDTEITYESLASLGSMMGSGGLIVMDEDDCMVSVARFFLDFTLDESCGKCTPCRVGNKRLYEMLDEICSGKGTMMTLAKLRDLANTVKDTALCGLGQTAPNPILSTMRKFEEEYLEHIEQHKCRAGVCKQLITFTINDKCVGCTLCARNCPADAITGQRRKRHVVNQDKCVKCGVCYNVCKFHAIDRG